MRLDPVLSKAVRIARRRKFDEAIKILEPEVNRYHGSFTYYYLLGLSYLNSNIFGVALTYFKLAYEQKMREPSALLGLAVLYLNHGDTDKAVDLYLEVQSIDRNNKIVKKALNVIRKNPGPDNIGAWIESGYLHTLYPPFPKAAITGKAFSARIIIGAAGLGIILFSAYLIAIKAGFLPAGSQAGRRALPGEISLAAEEKESPVQVGGSYRQVLTRNQVLEEYNEALKFFAEYRDEAARVRLNRIIESNASEPIKNKARLLVSYMEIPGFDTLKDKFSYSEVSRDPFIYRDCHVIWRGMASNLKVEQSHTSFDFLVGYDTRRVLEGIVQVDFDFAVLVNPEYPLEILGRVIPVSDDSELKIRIAGVALNQTGLLEQIQNN